MSGFSDLVNVSFQDLTGYSASTDDDILGIVLPYHWGPVNNLRVFDRVSFYEAFPESLPISKKLSDAPDHFYDAYAQIKRFFAVGGSTVEVYRPILGAKYTGVTVDKYFVGLKYPGSIPSSLLPTECKKVVLNVSATKVELLADDEVIETYEGQFENPAAVEDGVTTFIPSLIESSLILGAFEKSRVESNLLNEISSGDEIPSDLDQTDVTKMSEGILEVFNDIDLSSATMLISPVLGNEYDDQLIRISEERMNCTSIIGYPITNTWDFDSIKSYLTDVKTKVTKMFSAFVCGREYVKLFSEDVLNNSLGGFCGRTAFIAKSVRVNQLASARTYGSYNGVLAKTLKFSEVLQLHNLGCTSVYMSSLGAQIFGVRSLYKKQTSYFGKFNVSRVLAAILKQVFPIAMDAIHTDAAANAVTRATYDTQFNSIINGFVANQNLQTDSYADLSASINTDALTKGGTELNILLSLHFIGLVEKVNIKVVATDSSVTAEII